MPVNLVTGVKKVKFEVVEKPTGWLGRPGSQKFLWLVTANDQQVFEVGRNNSYGFEPGKSYIGWLGIGGDVFSEKPKHPVRCSAKNVVPNWDKITSLA